MKWLDSFEKRLGSFETWLDSKLAGSMELEADLSRRRILTSLALNLVTHITIVGVGYVVLFTLGPTGLGLAVLLGFVVVYGIVGYLTYRYIQRRRCAPSPSPQPSAPTLP